MANRVSDHFIFPNETLSWSRKAINEFDSLCRDFFRQPNIQSITEFDAKSGLNEAKFVLMTDLPADAPRKVTEALVNTRHSFDQSLYAAIRALGITPVHDVYFPWTASPKDLQRRLEGTVNKGSNVLKIPKVLWPTLGSFEPYGRSDRHTGGDNMIRAMAKVANRKHTVRLTFDLIARSAGNVNISGDGPIQVLHPRWNPVKKQVVVARFGDHAKLNDYGYINVGIVFDEAGPLQNTPVLTALRRFLAKAEAVAEALEKETARVIGS